MPSKEPAVAVWDLPTRLFHWLLVILIANAWISWKWGDINMTWHMWNGYALLTLILFRVLWGFWGSSTSRFNQFVRGPKTTIDYLRSLKSNTPQHYLGHNPAGALSVLLLLLLIALQGSAGLFTSDDIMIEGPLAYLISSDLQEMLSGWHSIGFYIILGVATLHVAAVLGYLLIRKENLIRPMIDGHKPANLVPQDTLATLAPSSRAIITLLIAASGLWLILNVWNYI